MSDLVNDLSCMIWQVFSLCVFEDHLVGIRFVKPGSHWYFTPVQISNYKPRLVGEKCIKIQFKLLFFCQVVSRLALYFLSCFWSENLGLGGFTNKTSPGKGINADRVQTKFSLRLEKITLKFGFLSKKKKRVQCLLIFCMFWMSVYEITGSGFGDLFFRVQPN